MGPHWLDSHAPREIDYSAVIDEIAHLAFGDMHTYDVNPASFRFLSSYQIMVDFLDDFHIFHRPQMPISAVLDARSEGNAILTQKFRNPPKYRIGSPKP